MDPTRGGAPTKIANNPPLIASRRYADSTLRWELQLPSGSMPERRPLTRMLLVHVVKLTIKLKPKTSELKPKTSELKPKTPELKPETPRLKPQSPSPQNDSPRPQS